MDHEDPGQAEEPDGDEKAAVVARLQSGARDEDRNEQRHDRDVRRDHEVLDRYEQRRVPLGVGEQQREDESR